MRKFILAFTFIEVLIYLALLVIFISASIEGWHTLMSRTRADTALHSFAHAIELARSEAIKRGAVVTLCASKDKIQCTGEWDEGQLIFLDKKAKGVISTKQDIIAVLDGLPSGNQLRWKGKRTSHFIQINPDGTLKSQPGTLLYFPAGKDSHFTKALIISSTGRVRIFSPKN